MEVFFFAPSLNWWPGPLCIQDLIFFDTITGTPWKPTWLVGKFAIWRCISYWRLEFSNIMLVFAGVYMFVTSQVSSECNKLTSPSFFWWRRVFSDHPFKPAVSAGSPHLGDGWILGQSLAKDKTCPAPEVDTKRKCDCKVWVKHWWLFELPGRLDSYPFGISDLGLV